MCTYRCCCVSLVAVCSGETGRDEIEERPQGAVAELDLEPRYLVELLDDVEQVEGEQEAGHPEACHRNEVEPAASRMVRVITAAFDADETDQVEDLKTGLQVIFTLEILVNISVAVLVVVKTLFEYF